MKKANAVAVKSELTDKQELFCNLMIGGKSQIDAYCAAFNRKKLPAVYVDASRLANTPKILLRLEEMRAAIANHTTMTRAEYERVLEAKARFEPRQLYDTHGNPAELPNLDYNAAVGIAGFEVVEQFVELDEKKDGKKTGEKIKTAIGYTKKYKLVDSLKAAELLGKVRGWIKGDGDALVPVTIIIGSRHSGRKRPKVINGNGHAIEAS